jgi:cellulose synthase/poly-beta-1,6-N-acetylglucosamine synthase-like glycosyltransferase
MESKALLWAIPAYTFTGLAALWYLSTILLAALYQHVLYPRWRRRRYDPAYRPRCSLIVPCKGTPSHFRENLLAFLRQDYTPYEVIFCVESESDPAVPIIRSVLDARSSRPGEGRELPVRLVVAGLASTCAQKVHNQLAALQHVDAPEILVFADSDIAPSPGWLCELVLPLSDPGVAVASGFYWLSPQTAKGSLPTLGELAHCQMNRVMYMLFMASMPWGGLGFGVWGGGMALREADFHALGIASKWRESVVDDMSLAEIAVRRKLRKVLVPYCITPSDDLQRTWADAVDWFARQLMFVKAHIWGLWASIVAFCCAYLAVSALLPLSLLGLLLGRASFWEWGGGAALIVLAAEMLGVLGFALLGPSPNLLLDTLFAPVLRYALWISLAKTINVWTVHWSGVRYTIGRRGRVLRIER